MSETNTATVPVSVIRDYFGMATGEFTKQWRELSDQDKADIRKGFNDGSMTY